MSPPGRSISLKIAEKIANLLAIPTIGIGPGTGCGGQVLVINDLIGLNTRPAPSFAKPKADVASLIRQSVESYVAEVKQPLPAST